MNTRRNGCKKVLTLLLTLIMVLGMLPVAAPHTHAQEEEQPVTTAKGPAVSAQDVFTVFTADDLTDEDRGKTFLYVICAQDRYYTLKKMEQGEYTSVPAVDITDYRQADGSFSGIPESAGVAYLHFMLHADSYYENVFYTDDTNSMSINLPWEPTGETYVGTIDFQTYSGDAFWEAYADDDAGFLYEIDSYYDDNDVFHRFHGAISLGFDSEGTPFFAVKDISESIYEVDYEVFHNRDVVAYLYETGCKHPYTVHEGYVAPTCMDKGCQEYWYCPDCGHYYLDGAFARDYGNYKPVLPATGHDWQQGACQNCHIPVPTYTRVTSMTEVRNHPEGTSYILVTQVGEKTYAMKMPDTRTVADTNENGRLDVLDPDDNQNGTPDLLEIDEDQNGVWDYTEVDWDESGSHDWYDEECYINELLGIEYIGYYSDSAFAGQVEVTPAADGSISVLGLDALEFIMERKYSDQEIEQMPLYPQSDIRQSDLENDVLLRVPNFWFETDFSLQNNNYQSIHDMGDSTWWGLLFYPDVLEFASVAEEGRFGSNVSNFTEDSLILWREEFTGINDCYQIRGQVRYRVPDNASQPGGFMMGLDEYLMIDEETYAYYDDTVGGSCWVTGDTQYAVYLYASAKADATQPEHTHTWSDWVITEGGVNHKRTCTADGCQAFELEGHTWDGTYVYDSENGHTLTCSVCGGTNIGMHELESRSYWEDTGDGMHHAKYCKLCGGIAQIGEHNWGAWNKVGTNTSTGTVYFHYRSCSVSNCYAEQRQDDCVYGEGVVTVQPTCTEPGEMTYTCLASNCGQTKTETIPATGHSWGKPVDDEDGLTHTAACSCGQILQEAHTFDGGKVIQMPTVDQEGEKLCTCTGCGRTVTVTMPKLDPVEQIVNTQQNTKLDVAPESSAVIDKNTVLVVEPMDEDKVEDTQETAKENIAIVGGEDAELIHAYDIALVLDGAEVQPGGAVVITLPALPPENFYKDVQVVYIDDEGNVTPCQTEVNADGTISFVTDHFSCYAVLATPIETPLVPDIAVEQWNITLQEDLKVNFHLNMAENERVRITVAGEETVLETAQMEKTETGAYVASVRLAAAQMTDRITLQILGDGGASETAEYTVRQYADTILADAAHSDYHALVRQMLNYGAQAQAYFAYQTGTLANAGITNAELTDIPASAETPFAVTDNLEGVDLYAASLLYHDRVAVRFYFRMTTGAENYVFTVGGTVCQPEYDGEYWFVDATGITPEKLSEQIAVSVTDGEGNALTAGYSPMNYIVRMNSKGSDSLKLLLKALYNYHLAAKAFCA